MDGNYFLKLGVVSLSPSLFSSPIYNYFKEIIYKSGQNGLLQFIAWDAKCPITYTLSPLHCRLETVQHSATAGYWVLASKTG